jgi:hypothetical protein
MGGAAVPDEEMHARPHPPAPSPRRCRRSSYALDAAAHQYWRTSVRALALMPTAVVRGAPAPGASYARRAQHSCVGSPAGSAMSYSLRMHPPRLSVCTAATITGAAVRLRGARAEHASRAAAPAGGHRNVRACGARLPRFLGRRAYFACPAAGTLGSCLFVSASAHDARSSLDVSCRRCMRYPAGKVGRT